MNLLNVAICWLIGFSFVLAFWRDERTPRQILHDTWEAIWQLLSDLFYAGRTLTPHQVLLIVILQLLAIIAIFYALYSRVGVLPW